MKEKRCMLRERKERREKEGRGRREEEEEKRERRKKKRERGRKKKRRRGEVAGCGAAGPAKNCIFRRFLGLPGMFSLRF